MIPIVFQVVGEEDYALKIRVEDSGAYVVESGTYSSSPPRKGQLTDSQERELLQAVKALGVPRPHPMPEGAAAFEAHLTVGGPGEETNYAFWEGALEEDAELAALVRLLELL
jgi:hypothetical protein